MRPFDYAADTDNDDRKEACRNEGSLICETDLRKVQGDQEKRQNHDYLREPEAQTKTGLITDSRQDDGSCNIYEAECDGTGHNRIGIMMRR